MATTTNYGWTTPDDTALVKDGAAAIRTLGSSVDTTTKNLNPSTTAGDIEFRSSTANVNTRLAIGAAGSRLVSDGSVPSWSTPPAFLARINTNQSIATSTITKVAFDTEIFDTASAYDPTTNYRFTVPAGQGGYYLIGFDVAWGVYTAAHQVFMYIYKNGSAYEAPLIPHRDGGSDVVATGTFSKVVQLAATDYVEAFVQHNRGSNATLYNPNANFWGHKL